MKEVKAPPEFDDEDEDEDDVKLISNLILEIKVTDTSPCYIISFDLSQTHPLISHPLIRHNTPCNTPSALINLIRSTSSLPPPQGSKELGDPPKTYLQDGCLLALAAAETDHDIVTPARFEEMMKGIVTRRYVFEYCVTHSSMRCHTSSSPLCTIFLIFLLLHNTPSILHTIYPLTTTHYTLSQPTPSPTIIYIDLPTRFCSLSRAGNLKRAKRFFARFGPWLNVDALEEDR